MEPGPAERTSAGAVGAPDGLIERPRLLARLAAVPLAVLSAPSGYGKATLAGAAAAARGGPVVRARFADADRSDDGATRLLAGLVAAFPHLGAQPPVADGTGPARLADALADLAGPATLVLEELHLLEGTGDRLLGTVVDALDPSVAVVVTTEGEAPTVAVRRAARGDAVLLGAADLLLDAPECAALAAAAGGVVDGAALLDRSGGWPLAAAALARTGGGVEDVLARDALAELGPTARDVLAAVALLASVPRDAVVDAAAVELTRFARRHPALLEVDDERWRVRDLLRGRLADTPPSEPTVVALVDRLERLGHDDEGLILLSRLPGDRDLLRHRLELRGPSLVDAGRHTLVRSLVTAVPPARRRATLSVLDAAAALGLDQVAPEERGGFRIDDAALVRLGDALVDDADGAGDLEVAVAGLRTEFLRRRGDPGLVAVALGAVPLIGDVGPDADPAALVAGRHPLARRGVVSVLAGLGAAAQFSGDPAMIAEGARLVDLALRCAERSGADPVPLRGQAAYERLLIGLEAPADVLAPLEAGVASLRAVGHPEAANLLAELADSHLRCGDPAAAVAVADEGEEWARRTANDLALPGLALVRAAAALAEHGPSAATDAELDAAWAALVAGPRLRRAQPSLAYRVANAHLDHFDTGRAARWLERGRARVGDSVQGPYAQAFLASVEERLAWQTGRAPLPDPEADDRFAAQPIGRAERIATLAWDQLRRGEPGPAAAALARWGALLGPPWVDRLAAAPAPAAADAARAAGPAPSSPPSPTSGTGSDPRVAGAVPGAAVVIRLLCPALRVERGGHVVATPTGHAARLLALLVVADGAMTTDAVVDDLWPDAEPSVARNRLHQVLHRARRALGVGADGPLRVHDGVVVLERGELDSDVWRWRSLGPDDPERLAAAVGDYASPLLAGQFAYDDRFDDARWELSRRLADAVVDLLAGAADTDPAHLAVVWDAWQRLPDEDRVGLALADALDAAGDAARAAEVRRRVAARAGD